MFDHIENFQIIIDRHSNSEHAAREIVHEMYKGIAENWAGTDFLKAECLWFADQALIISDGD